jgi:hypothetical protein
MPRTQHQSQLNRMAGVSLHESDSWRDVKPLAHARTGEAFVGALSPEGGPDRVLRGTDALEAPWT